MASSVDNNKSEIDVTFGPIAANELQKINDDTKSAESAELIDPTTLNNVDINNLLLSDVGSVVDDTVTDRPRPSPRSTIFINKCLNIFDSTEQRMASTLRSLNTSNRFDTRSESMIGQQPTQDCTTKTDGHPTTTTRERHIMISYNIRSFAICYEIYQRLTGLGYKAWIDESNLHERILEGMAQAIENSYIVLMCYTDKYSKSDYCLLEAAYTFQKRIDFIPCRLQQSYHPNGWLGVLIADRLYIDFAPPNDFENSFKQLIKEIESIKTPSQTYANRSEIFPWNDENLNAWANNQRNREKFSKIIREYVESINKNEQDLNLLDKEELCELIRRLKDRLFDDSLSTFDSNQRNISIMLRDIFVKAKDHKELLNEITVLLSKPIDSKTIIKLSMAFLFVWTVKTHIIDAYLKQQ